MSESQESSYSWEVDLILCCARTSIDPEIHQRVTRLVQEDVDWTFLFETAFRNGVLALLFQNLNTICPESIPPAYATRLPELFQFHTRRNQFLAQELIAILHEFEKEGIPAIPFKGPVLAAMAYGDLSLREFVDLDILTPQQHLSKAYEVLRSVGYRRRGEDNGRQRIEPEANDYHTFVRGTGIAQVNVDLQCRIKQGQFSFNLDRKEVWTHRTEVLLEGVRVSSLRAEDLLLILCVHGSKHLWEKLKWVCDVAELVRAHGQNMKWQLVIAQANRYGARPMVELGLGLAHDLVSTRALEKALTQVHLSNPRIRAMTRQVGQQMFRQKTHQPGNFERAAFYLSLRDRWPDRMRYYCFLTLQIPSRDDWNLLPHPFLFRLFYYCSLPLRLTIKHSLQAPKMKRAIVQWLEGMG